MSLRAEKMRTQKVLNKIETKSNPVGPRTTVEGFAGRTSEHGDCAWIDVVQFGVVEEPVTQTFECQHGHLTFSSLQGFEQKAALRPGNQPVRQSMQYQKRRSAPLHIRDRIRQLHLLWGTLDWNPKKT